MIIKSFLSFTLLFLGFQNLQAQTDETEIKDFNQDGVNDTLKVWYDGGSGFGGYYVKAQNGKTGQIYEMDTWTCFCEIKTIVPLPPDFDSSENAPFYKAITSKLFPTIKDDIDPTLDWIIQANLKSIKPEDDSLFDLILPVELTWIGDKIQKPSNYQVLVDDLLIRTMYSPSKEPPSWIGEAKSGFLAYYPHNHELQVKALPSNMEGYSFLQGKHSLIYKNEDKEAVVFITDHSLTSGPERLRDPSLAHFESSGEYAFFTVSEASEPSYRIYLIHLNRGTIARLKQTLEGYSGNFGIEENNFFNAEGELVFENVSEVIVQFNLQNPLFK
jgi:hypothetical protein